MKWLGIFLFALPVWANDFTDSCRTKNNAPVTTLAGPSANTLKVRDIFKANCASCHTAGSTFSKKFDDILNAQTLREKNIVDTANPIKSLLYESLTRDKKRMPLGQDALSTADLSEILEWMQKGAPDFIGSPVNVQTITPADERECIAFDLEKVENNKRKVLKDQDEARYIRYAVLSEVYLQGDTDRFRKVVWALDIAINRVSFFQHLGKTRPVDSNGVIRRIDLRDFGIDPDRWDKLVLERYPYAIDFFDKEDFEIFELKIAQRTKSPLAFVRGDWLIRELSQPPLYYDFLLPGIDTQQKLEKLLGVNQFQRFEDQQYYRAGIRRSGVANSNRLIDRFDLRYWVQGQRIDTYYWITYDANANLLADPFRDFFSFPFGPRFASYYSGHDASWYEQEKLFNHDAGEIIFGLPNGLMGYFLANQQGVRQERVPTNIATDRSNTAPYVGENPYEIVNGVSCAKCHSSGILPYTDQLRTSVRHTAGFSKKQLDLLNDLIPDQKELDRGIEDHSAQYQLALGTITQDPSILDPNSEPVFYTAHYYEDTLSIDQAARELKIPSDDFQDCLYHEPKLALVIFPGAYPTDYKTPSIARDLFEDQFGNVLRQCNIGKQLVFKKVVVPKKACKIVVKNAYNQSVRFLFQNQVFELDAGTFREWDYEPTKSEVLTYSGRNYNNRWTVSGCNSYYFDTRNGLVSLFASSK